MSNIYEVNEITHPEVKHVRIRLNNGWDIIRVTYTDTGFIQIFSSFGHYAYNWTAMGEGVTLQQFFGDRTSGCNHYLANKLWHGTRQEQTYFDLDEAIKQAKAYIKEETACCEDTFEEIAFEIENYIEGMGDSRDLFISSWMNNSLLNEWIPDIYEYSFGQVLRGRYLTLLNEIIPVIQKYFRGELESGTQVLQSSN